MCAHFWFNRRILTQFSTREQTHTPAITHAELDHCCETMARERIDCATLYLLSHEQLQELGVVRLGDRMKLLLRAQTLLRTGRSDSTTPPTHHKVSVQLPDVDPDSRASIKSPSPPTSRSAPTRSSSSTANSPTSRNGLSDLLYGFHARRFRV